MVKEITEYAIKRNDSGPYGVVAADGKVWFTQHKANAISCIDQNGHIEEFIVPTPNAKVMCLTVSSNNEVWFTEYDANKIGKLTITGEFIEYPLPHSASAPYVSLSVLSCPDSSDNLHYN